jgi:hypothetical protein
VIGYVTIYVGKSDSKMLTANECHSIVFQYKAGQRPSHDRAGINSDAIGPNVGLMARGMTVNNDNVV